MSSPHLLWDITGSQTVKRRLRCRCLHRRPRRRLGQGGFETIFVNTERQNSPKIRTYFRSPKLKLHVFLLDWQLQSWQVPDQRRPPAWPGLRVWGLVVEGGSRCSRSRWWQDDNPSSVKDEDLANFNGSKQGYIPPPNTTQKWYKYETLWGETMLKASRGSRCLGSHEICGFSWR